MAQVLGFVQSIISMIRTIYEMITTGVGYLMQIIGAMPVYFIAPLTAVVVVLVAYAILGRGS